jgi:hypothetical protein
MGFCKMVQQSSKDRIVRHGTVVVRSEDLADRFARGAFFFSTSPADRGRERGDQLIH